MKKPRPRKPVGRRRATPRRRPTISLCVIARDEEAFIGDCLASAQRFVDEIVVLDTGSTDATCEIARAHGARIGTFEWRDDFAAARNAAVDLATSDWILMLDADERLQAASGPRLQAFVAANGRAPYHYSVRIENREGNGPEDVQVSFAGRLFRRIAGLRYVGTIHELLSYLPDPARMQGMRVDFIRITHLGYMPAVVEARGKWDRNRRLLLRETEARPNDPLAWYYLGMDQMSAHRPVEAAEYLRRSLACGASNPTWSNVDAYTHLVLAYALSNDADQLQSIADEAEQAGALSVTARTTLARGFRDRGLYPEAARHLLAALKPNQPLDNVRKLGIGGWITRLDLARVYELMGDKQAALQQLESGLADPELTKRDDILDLAVRLGLEVGDTASLARSLDGMPQPAADDLEGHMRLLQLRSVAGPPSRTVAPFSAIDRAIGQGDWQAAYDAALTLSGRTMPEVARLLFVAVRLHSEGAPEAALNLLGHLHDTQPTLPQLHALLTTVLADLGRYDDALAANEIHQVLLATEKRAAAA